MFENKRIYTCLAMLGLLWLLAACEAGRSHLEWREGPLSAALQEAAPDRRVVVADVFATWCGPCKSMEEEIWSTPLGKELVADHVPWKIDFDSDLGQEFKQQYKILGLPTVLFLNADGTEIDRIQGYPGKDEFLELASKYMRGESRMIPARQAFEADPGSAENQLRFGELLLVRADETEAIRLLESAAEGEPEFASEALFLLGRYFHRVMEQPEVAVPYWRRLHTEHPETPWGGGALYWLLRAYESPGPGQEAMVAELFEGKILKSGSNFATAFDWLQHVGMDDRAAEMLQLGLSRYPADEALLERSEGDEAT